MEPIQQHRTRGPARARRAASRAEPVLWARVLRWPPPWGEQVRALVARHERGIAVIDLDLEGTIVAWNEGAERIFGYGPSEILGRDCAVLFTPEDRAEEIPVEEIGAAVAQGRADDTRWLLRKDGTRVFVRGLLAPLADDIGSVTGFVKVVCEAGDEELERVLREVEECLQPGGA